MNPKPRDILRGLIEKYGNTLVGDPRRCEALLRDLCGDHKREISVLVSAIRERVPAEILAPSQLLPAQSLYERLASRLEENIALSPEASRWAVSAWTFALDRKEPIWNQPTPGVDFARAIVPTPEPSTKTSAPFERASCKPTVQVADRNCPPDRPQPFRSSMFVAVGLSLVVVITMVLGWQAYRRAPTIQPRTTAPTHENGSGSAQDYLKTSKLDNESLRPGAIRVNARDNLRYAWIPPGKFAMGCSPADSECGYNERPSHEVSIRLGFWMSQTEVTQAAYQAVTGKPNPSQFKGDDLPVEQVAWEEAESYCEAVGMGLPTEAQWEYAARAGKAAARYGSPDEVAWYSGDSEERTHPVAQKSPNAWGLYDMLGNVWEWCDDWYGEFDEGRQDDPKGPAAGGQKILRGGSWEDSPRFIRDSRRFRYVPSYRYRTFGFRCAGDLR